MKRLLVLPVIMLTLPAAMCQTVRYQRVACVTKEQVEEFRKAKPGAIRDQLTGEADKDLRLVTGKLIRVEAWGDGLLDVLGNCSTQV